jgi:hypothetical protein
MISLVLLLITLSRWLLLEPFQAGVPSWLCFSSQRFESTKLFIRCTALPTDIDGLRGRRTRAFTDILLDTLDSKTLWDEYGIDDDIMVCKHCTRYSISNSVTALHP